MSIKISACYIVKNEEKHLRKSIESIRGVCDEIIVVDTGSEDDTMAIAAEMGAEVLQFAWMNDFSKARNFALAQATGDAVILLDADEWFEPALTKQHSRLLENYLRKGETVFNVKFVNLYENRATTESYLTRIISNHAGLKYINAIHEQIDYSALRYNLPDNFVVYHSGYLGDYSHKVERNRELLYAQIDEKSGRAANPAMYFYLARENNQLGNHEEAIRFVEQFFESLKEYAYPVNVLIGIRKLRLKLAVFDAPGKYTDAQREAYVKEFVAAFPRHPVPWEMKALYEFERKGDFAEVITSFNKMDEAQAAYRPSDYPDDFSTIESEWRLIGLSRAAACRQMGDNGRAFDNYLRVIQGASSLVALAGVLSMIAAQPARERMAFMDTLLSGPTDYEQLLNVLVYFRGCRDDYIYFSKKLLLETKQHSDVTALAALLLGDTENPMHVAKSMQGDPMGCVLLCTAAFTAMDETLLNGMRVDEMAKGVAEHFFRGKPMADVEDVEWKLIAMLYRQMLFAAGDEAIARLDRLLNGEPFMRFILYSCYYNVSENHRGIVESFDMDTEELPPEQAAYCLPILGRAFTGLKDAENALQCYQEYLALTQNLPEVRRELNILLSVCPAVAERVRALCEAYEGAAPRLLPMGEDGLRALRIVRGVFVAPEQGRLTMRI